MATDVKQAMNATTTELFRLITTPQSNEFVSSCVVGHYDDESDTMWVYDGQQRITTFVCTMAVLLADELNHTNDSDIIEKIEELRKTLKKFSFDNREKANQIIEILCT
ncbi:MAG: DUF262 domain-containing protein, partial [Lachnospiraceae bacterium]|nr:DUF262 domain-containing protein [Lachnospiraceae bacterium]